MYTGQKRCIPDKKDVYWTKKMYTGRKRYIVTKKSVKSYLKGYPFKYDFFIWGKGGILLWQNGGTVGQRKKLHGI